MVRVRAMTVSSPPLRPAAISAEGWPRSRTAPSTSSTISITGRSPARMAARAAFSPAAPLNSGRRYCRAEQFGSRAAPVKSTMTSAVPVRACIRSGLIFSLSAPLCLPLCNTKRSSSNSMSRPVGRGSAVAVHAIWTGTSRKSIDSVSRAIHRRACSISQRNSMIMSSRSVSESIRLNASRSNDLAENSNVFLHHGVH
ncbi:hypothetical protein ACVWWO_008515 [Bradyrhizobium sp. F1.13.1]